MRTDHDHTQQVRLFTQLYLHPEALHVRSVPAVGTQTQRVFPATGKNSRHIASAVEIDFIADLESKKAFRRPADNSCRSPVWIRENCPEVIELHQVRERSAHDHEDRVEIDFLGRCSANFSQGGAFHHQVLGFLVVDGVANAGRNLGHDLAHYFDVVRSVGVSVATSNSDGPINCSNWHRHLRVKSVIGRVQETVRTAADRQNGPTDFVFGCLQPGNEFELHLSVAPCRGDGQAIVGDKRGQVIAEPDEYPVEVEVPVRADANGGNDPALVLGSIQHHHCAGGDPGLSPAEPQRAREDAAQYGGDFDQRKPRTGAAAKPMKTKFDHEDGDNDRSGWSVGDHSETICTVVCGKRAQRTTKPFRPVFQMC